ncbi:MAG TPA: hypothetical protein DIW81_06435 [Planctomycetaceae bacterium]|nr:hypothetical protein [Planctomycetaceae bacterium]
MEGGGERLKCLFRRQLRPAEHAAGDRKHAQFIRSLVGAPIRGTEGLFHPQPEATQQTISDRQHEQ